MNWTLFSSDGPAARWKLRWALRGSWRRTMQYSEARQRADGRWEYCCRQDGLFIPAGYCAGSDPVVAVGGDESAADATVHHCDGHATRQEAEACYRRYQLDHLLALDGDLSVARRCEAPGCETTTSGVATLGHQRFSLCDAHRTRDLVAELAGDRAGACLSPETSKPPREPEDPHAERDFLVPFPVLVGDGVDPSEQ